MMDIYDMRRTTNQAKQTIRDAEEVANNLVGFLADNGRLRSCSSYHLAQLKKELKNFNAHTGKWK